MSNDIIGEITQGGTIIGEISGMTYQAVEAELLALQTGKADKLTTYTKIEVDGKDTLKADKIQEGWITPTLLNGWTPFSTELSTCQYMKDQLGFVHLRGLIKNGTADHLMTLPIGYRPGKNIYFSTVSNWQFGWGNISGDGVVAVHSYNIEWLSMDNISFRAEG